MLVLYGVYVTVALQLFSATEAQRNCPLLPYNRSYYNDLPDPGFAVPSYVLIAPGGLRLNVPYQVTVALLEDIQSPSDITATIYRTEYINGENKNFELATDTVKGTKKNLNTLTLTISKKLPNYPNIYLNVLSSGGLVLNETKNIQYLSKNHSAFLQTDKGIYQPGETVHFRLFVVDKDMRPYTPNTPIVVKIYDTQNNLIKQWQPDSLNKFGIFQESLELSDRPNLGSWRLQADTDGLQTNVYISVEEYVLPTWEANVVAPSVVTWKDGSIPVTVTARYTFDKPVDGTVVLFATRSCYSYNDYRDKNCNYNTTKTLNLADGKAEFKLPILTFKGTDDVKSLYININVNVTETATGKTIMDSTSTSITDERYSIDVTSEDKNFLPGMKLKFKVTVRDQANNVVTKADEPITVSYTGLVRQYTYHSGDFTNVSVSLTKDGTADVTLPTTAKDEYILVKIFYKKFSTVASFSRYPSQTGKYISITRTNPKRDISPGDTAEFQIDGTYKIDKLMYAVVGRSQVLLSAMATTRNSKTIKISFKVTQEMGPTSNLVAYTITPCGEIVANFIQFKVVNLLKTPVSISASPNETDVGKMVNIKVNTNPNAWVGISAVDQSVLLLRNGNDVTEQAVSSEIDSYNLNNGIMLRYLPINNRDQSIGQIFTGSGLLFGTNSPYNDAEFFNSNQCPIYYNRINSFSKGAQGGLAEASVSFGAAMDGAMAPAGAPAPMAPVDADMVDESSLTTRKSFPQTWFFIDGTAGQDGSAVFPVKVPDTITTWVIAPVAMDPKTGLGVTDNRAKVLAIRQFFVNLDLPYSVVRGETLELKCIVFNYQKDAQTKVTLSKTMNDFEFVDSKGTVLTGTQNQTKTVTVESGKPLTVTFMIKPTTVGMATFKVSAVSTVGGDIIEKQLLIKAEGTPVYFNTPLFVDLRKANSPPFSSSVNVTVPDKAVKDSERIECGVIGDVLGSTMDNVEDLLQQPLEGGEPNMINLVVNILVMNYLKGTNRLTDEIKNKGIPYISKGYQQELTYRRSDGSFSSFGPKDPQGSTWLTAYVAKYLIESTAYITVDDNVILSAINYLLTRQNINGTFLELGYVFNKRLEGGVSKSYTGLTAYVLITLVRYKDYYAKTAQPNDQFAVRLNNAILGGRNKLEKELSGITDVYILAIVTYALHVSGSPSKDTAFNKFSVLAIKKGGYIYWEAGKSSNDPYVYYGIPSNNIEATSYGLLTYLLRSGLQNDQLQIFRWLLEHRTSYGGYSTTQATALGLEAISKMAANVYPDLNTNINVACQYLTNGKVQFKVDKTNFMYLQSKVIDKKARSVAISADGKGFTIVQVSWSYNVLYVDDSSDFGLTSTVTVNTTNYFQNVVCAQYLGSETDSGMAILEFNFPTGYVADPENIPQLSGSLQFVNQKNRGTLLELYFDKLTKAQTCVTVTAQRSYTAYNLAKSAVRVYAFYAPEKRRTIFYSI